MSTMRNSVILIGVPTQVIIKDNNNVIKQARFKLKVQETYKNSNNEFVTRCDVFDCVGYNGTTIRIAEKVKEGCELAIEGSLRSYGWQDEKGYHQHIEVEVNDLFIIGKTKKED